VVAAAEEEYDSGNDLPYPTIDIEEIKAMPMGEIAVTSGIRSDFGTELRVLGQMRCLEHFFSWFKMGHLF